MTPRWQTKESCLREVTQTSPSMASNAEDSVVNSANEVAPGAATVVTIALEGGEKLQFPEACGRLTHEVELRSAFEAGVAMSTLQ